MSHVWIAMDNESYEPTKIYGVARTMDGAKALCQAQEQKREIRWDTAGETGVTGYGSMYHACERYEVTEA